jgi:hypothetical protein
MPRISRNAVQFTVDGTTYTAEFRHTHNESGLEHYINGEKRIGKHLTHCRLSADGEPGAANGYSLCVMEDEYKWKIGIKKSLERALAVMGLCEFKRGIARDGNRKLICVPTNEQYGRMLKAFYEELPIKAYGPHVAVQEAAA